MIFLKSEPNMGYYLINYNGKNYFVFDVYDNPSLLHMYEVDEEDVKLIMSHTGDGLSLDKLLILKHQYDQVIDRQDFEQNNIISSKKR